jgi:hypothetical protein
VIARIVLWNLSESKTTLDELRTRLPESRDGDSWISNAAQERFGLISFADELPNLRTLTELIGDEPVVVEEFDVE